MWTQQDALMIEPLSDDFFQYDFIEAPWNPNKFFQLLSLNMLLERLVSIKKFGSVVSRIKTETLRTL